MARVFLSIGSNMGDKRAYLDQAVERLGQHDQIQVQAQSSYYETDPVGYTEQDLFLNIGLELDTMLKPEDLLSVCQAIELDLHRERLIRWGPRTVDIDIIFYDDLSMSTEDLILPHPRALERGFVMWPIYEIAGDLIVQGRPIKELIQDLPAEGIRKL